MLSLLPFAILTRLQGDPNLLLYGGGAAGVMVFVAFVLVVFRRRKRPVHEEGLAEDLASIPAPKGPRPFLLRVRGYPARLRLVVVAPAGKTDLGKVDSVLEQVYRGLGETALADRPRFRVWPAQLSRAGFAPTFFRNARRPGPDGQPSRWALLAGPARAGGRTVLLGLAVETDEPTELGTLTMEEHAWADVLRIEKA